MKHYGDITKLSGCDLPVVDVITGGSPCQDLSVAGKRAGLDGERSGLFMEQIRIVKEMRENDKRTGRTGWQVRPRYMVWENVPGALSSPGKRNGEDHRGEDFQAVLTEIVRIVNKNAPDVPLPGRGGWPKSGCIMGYGSDGCPFSIAYRVHDAQFWGATQYADGRMLFCGTPQRRKRIALVADFGGLSAGEICFERKGLSWHSDKSGEERKGVAGDTEGSSVKAIKDGVVFSAGFCTEHSADSHGIGYEEEKSPTLKAGTVPGAVVLCDQGGQRMDVTDGITTTLRAESNHPPIVFGIGGYNSKGMLSNNPKAGIYKADTSRTLDENGGNPGCNHGGMVVLEGNGSRPSHQGDGFRESDVMYTLNATEVHAVLKSPEPTLIEMTSTKNTIVEDGKCPTLTARMGTGGNQVNAVFVENHPADGRCDVRNDGVCQTLTGRMGTGGNNVPLCMDVGMFSVQEDCSNPLLARQFKDPPVVNTGVLRRLTPMDCERLQGFPDGWTDIGPWMDSKGKLHKESSDSARYKALGNSICIPFWFYLLRRIAAQYERPATLGSLFDGIGGFPLAWERCNGKGTAIWASEIEDFPIAVTKHHFPE